MRAKVWGCRGSIAAPGASTKRYGGNTSCVEIRTDDDVLLIMDAGTGIRELGSRLVEEGVDQINLFITHLHVDHVEGLGMFAPMYQAGTTVRIWGPASPVASLHERISTYFSPPLFPLHLSEVPATIEYHDASESEWAIDDLRVISHAILHPGQTVGYRIHADGRTLSYLTDHEPALGADLRLDDPGWISGFALAQRADLLIHDCQYTPGEYAGRMGWGHSSTEHVAVMAARTEAERLLLFHHDPMHTDEQLEAMREDVRARWGVGPERCELAAEGMELEV